MRVVCALLVCFMAATTAVAADQAPRQVSPKSQPTHSVKRANHKALPKTTKALASRASSEKENYPTALARHMRRLEASPAFGTEADGSAATAADEAFAHRAYPDTDISLERIDGSRSAFAALKNHKFPTGRGRPGTWVTVGPSIAEYPLFPFRNSFNYVPNTYDAGGRTTSLALAGDCVPGHCRLYAGPAGGGLWRADDVLTGEPSWQYMSAPFAINAVGSIAVDPNDASGNTLWVGTGEANACGSGCEAGVGLYKSSDGGQTWTGPIGFSVFDARSIGSIAIKPGDPNTLYVATTRGLRGASSTCCGGAVTLVPGAPPWGLYKSTDGGATWTFIHNGAATTTGCTNTTNVANNLTACSVRGVRRVALDPSNPDIVYAGSFGRGVWRSSDGGATWTQIKPSLNAADASMRPEFAVTALGNGSTRMYVAEGTSGNPYSRLFRSDSVATGSPTFTQLTSNNPADLGYGSYNYCGGQCWYDNYVVTPKGYPDMVYLLGSYAYGETGGISNGRGVVLSTDAGVSFTDMTMDATDVLHPNGLHPDQHFLVVNPNNPFQFFESSDGGIMRSSGQFADVSANCDTRGLADPALSRCHQLLSRVPTQLSSLNKGLTTLQFQSLSVSPFNSNVLMGGTQDNGTWQSTGNPVKWLNSMIGDGGLSGFDVADPQFRFHTFAGQEPDINLSGGAIIDWNWIGDPLFNGDASEFYFPIISDPVVSGTMYSGTAHVWRTKTHGMGTMTVDEFRGHCNEWTGDFTVLCGDWAPLGGSASTARLTSTSYGSTRSGGDVAHVTRAAGDTSTLWAATSTGRLFITKNADAEPAASVTFTRLDTLVTNAPNRYITGIYVDPANANHAWISYDGFSASTPQVPGHVFEATYNPVTTAFTMTDLSYDVGDIPVTGLVRDDATGDLYGSSDFGVFRLAGGTTSWTLAAAGMPNVEVAGLTIVPGARKLYAATHGLGAWVLNLQ